MEQIKNEKTFFHVFPTLKVEEEFKVLFADVEVKKITTNSGRDFLHVHLKSHHLIPKRKYGRWSSGSKSSSLEHLL